MRLLIINFEMDPDSKVLAWQLSVALDLANLCEQVVVLTNRSGDFSCPANMSVYRFPKILFRAPLRWLGGKWWMNLFVLYLCKRYAIKACFIHMNMEWGYRLAPVFSLLKIPVLLWYAHGTVTDELKRAHRYVTRVVTSTPEGFRLPSNKLSIIGQGVDTSLFTIQELAPSATDILTVGRISSRKRLDLLIDVMDALVGLDPATPFRLIIIGAPLTAQDQAYQEQLVEKAAQSQASQRIQFVGHVSTACIPAYYRTAFLHLNLSLTGSMDKTVMESLAAGCPVLTGNEAFCEVLSDFPDFLVSNEDPKSIAQQIRNLYLQQGNIDRQALRSIVVGKHDLATYGLRILEEFRKINA